MNEVLTKPEQQILDVLLEQNRELIEPIIEKLGAKETVERVVWIKMMNEEQQDLFIKLAKEMLNNN
ncbi:hypothetical protein Q604_UNBc4C00004G0004 [human gut metagenome]|uniref:Uncharacterized protein n=1 Tax=human gut metagenome TaxID=408170 RepID=W1WLK1_9ZZZZ